MKGLSKTSSVSERQYDLSKYCAPIYLGNYFLQDGLGAETVSATITFVRFHGSVWGVTCRHVSHNRNYHWNGKEEEGGIWRLVAGRVVYNLGNLQCGEIQNGLLSPDQSAVDLAFVNLDYCWQELEKRHSYRAIELIPESITDDKDLFPDFESALAIGFPNSGKSLIPFAEDQKISHKLLKICAALDNERWIERDTFSLHTGLQGLSIGISGCSGGPVFSQPPIDDAFDHWKPELLGIIYEGSPSFKGAETGILGGDVLVFGLKVTQERFSEWLTAAK